MFLSLRKVGLVVSILLIGLCACNNGKSHNKDTMIVKPLTDPATIARVEKFCGACHPNPSPSSFPKNLWPHEVEQGFQFYRDANHLHLEEPMLKDVLAYFQSQAPAEVQLPSAEQIENFPARLTFAPSATILTGDPTSLTAHVFWEQSRQEFCLRT